MKQEANNMKNKKNREKEKKRQRKLEIPDFLTHLIVSPHCLSEQQNKAGLLWVECRKCFLLLPLCRI